MKKKIMFGVLAMFLVVTALALTQSQVDNTDFDTVNLNLTWGNWEVVNDVIVRNYSFNYLNFDGNETFNVVRKSRNLQVIMYDDYEFCKTLYPQSDCVNYVKMTATMKRQTETVLIRNALKNFQTQEEITIGEFA